MNNLKILLTDQRMLSQLNPEDVYSSDLIISNSPEHTNIIILKDRYETADMTLTDILNFLNRR